MYGMYEGLSGELTGRQKARARVNAAAAVAKRNFVNRMAAYDGATANNLPRVETDVSSSQTSSVPEQKVTDIAVEATTPQPLSTAS